MGQIALPLAWPTAEGEGDFLISEANRAAFDHLQRWSEWPVMAALLTGPARSGRSLLGRIFARKTGGRLFDDAEGGDEETLFHAWNEAQERRRPLLIVAGATPPTWQVGLPDLRSRLAATPHIRIEEPDDALMGALVVKLLAGRGIALPPDVADYLVSRVERSYGVAREVVDVLDRAALSHHRRITVPMAKQALVEAGLIEEAERRA